MVLINLQSARCSWLRRKSCESCFVVFPAQIADPVCCRFSLWSPSLPWNVNLCHLLPVISLNEVRFSWRHMNCFCFQLPTTALFWGDFGFGSTFCFCFGQFWSPAGDFQSRWCSCLKNNTNRLKQNEDNCYLQTTNWRTDSERNIYMDLNAVTQHSGPKMKNKSWGFMLM